MPTRQSSNSEPTRRSARLARTSISATRPATSRSATRTVNRHQPRTQTHKPPTNDYESLQEEPTTPEEPILATDPTNAVVSVPNHLLPIVKWANHGHAIADALDGTTTTYTQSSD